MTILYDDGLHPKYLTCPYCPSQAYPVHPNDPFLWVGGFKAFQPMLQYKCPAKHVFYAEVDIPESEVLARIPATKEVHDVQTER